VTHVFCDLLGKLNYVLQLNTVYLQVEIFNDIFLENFSDQNYEELPNEWPITLPPKLVKDRFAVQGKEVKQL
jgi:hypothetical protein